MNFTETLQTFTGKPLSACTNQELYLALLELVRRKSADRVQPVKGRKLYYISAEFLIGKLLSNNLINLGLYDEARDALAAAGKSLAEIEEVEPEPSLGNGGLGRLAACFLDSLATLNLPGDGVGLRYHFGLFRQSFENGVQNEKPDPWLTAHSWAEKTDVTYPVELAGKEYTARLYKLAVTGYEGRTNTLNLFDLDTIDESIVHDGIAFDKTAIDKNLTLFLYPDDSDEAGRRLRVYQQYLMVSAGAQLILAECAARGCNYHDLSDYAAIQINDTHPSMVIPELIRLLGEKGIDFDEAVEIVTKTCAYTNHTILAEALEKWPRSYRQARREEPVARVLVEAHRRHQRCDLRRQFRFEYRLLGHGIHAAVGDRRGHRCELLGRHADRTLARVDVQRHVGIVVNPVVILQQPCDRLVVEVGRRLRFVQLVDHFDLRSGQPFDKTDDRLPFAVAVADGFHHRAARLSDSSWHFPFSWRVPIPRK